MGLGGLSLGVIAVAAVALLVGVLLSQHPQSTTGLLEWQRSLFGAPPAVTPVAVTSTPPERPAPLARFLRASDADHAIAAAKLFVDDYDSPAYLASLNYLLENEWHSSPQGIYNLLQHSYMIPGEVRFATLERGLEEEDDIQYRLAAAVGVQFTPKPHLDQSPLADRRFRELLLNHAAAHEQDDFLAARAFLGIRERLQHPRDTNFVLALMGDLNWRNCVTWLLKQVATPEQPLTSERLRELLTAAIEADKLASAAGSTAPASADPTALAWTPEWSARLQQLDIEHVMRIAGAALDEHARIDPARAPAKLLRYQEIEVPSYAHLQMGHMGEDGTASFAPAAGSNQPTETSPTSTTEPIASESATPPPPTPPAADSPFQPDAIVFGDEVPM